MFKSTSVIFIALFVQSTLSQILIEGNCPELKVVENFDLAKYCGEWFGYAKYDFAVNSNLKCNKAIYTDKGAYNLVVENIGVTKDSNKQVSVQWPGRVIDSAKLSIWYDNRQCLGYPNYLVLGTDYKNWASVHNCRQINETHTEQTAWLLTRERNPKSSVVKAAKNAFKANDVIVEYLIENDQTDCKEEDNKLKISLFSFFG